MVALNLVSRPNKRRPAPDQVSELTTNRLSIYLRCLNELDLARWKKDLTSPQVKDRVEHDHRAGGELKLKGTPTLYVNGRELNIEEDESLEERVSSELDVLAAAAAAAAAGQAAPQAVPGQPPR